MVKPVTIKFFPRTDQVLKGGKVPIYVRVILDREKFDFSTKQVLDKLSDWDDKTQRVRLKSPINAALSEIEYRVHDAYNFLKYHNKPLTALALRNKLYGEKDQKLRLLDFVEDYIAIKIKGNNELAITTQKNYQSTVTHLRGFLEETQKLRMKVAEVDLDFVKEFDDYLVTRSMKDGEGRRGLKKNSANKYHVNLKSMLFKAVDRKMLEKNPYKEFKFKSEPGRLTYLTSNELADLEKHDLGENPSLQRVRDIFLFSVYTGLRHSDATNLKESNIELEGTDYWIAYTQQKTGNQNRIPMLKRAVEIYDKYEEERKKTGFVLPRLSHQKLNTFLKVIATMVGIKKPLSHHVARHTAATTIYMKNGISLETTGKLLGHRSIKSTEIYAKITNMMLKEAANKLNKIL